jgi:hypothetical protein
MSTALFFGLAQACYFSSLVVKPSPYRPLFMVPIVLGIVLFFRFTMQCHTPLEYIYGCGAAALPIWASSYILLIDVQRELFTRGQKEPAYRLPLLERVKWALKLNGACRCVGWSHEPTRSLPPPISPSVTRVKFVLQEIIRLALDILLYDAFKTYTKRNPSFSASGSSIAEDGIFWRFVNVLVLGLGGAVAIGIPYRLCSILFVSSGISEPIDWTPLFGRFLDAYTLCNFWGRTWHQTMRWIGISHGRFLAYDFFRLQKGSKAAFLVQLYTTFAVSALVHVGGEYPLVGYWTTRHAFRFFLLQPVAVTVETLVLGDGKMPIRGLWRVLGYLWVLAWFTYTVPEWIDPLLRAGLADAAPTVGIISHFI